MWREGERETLRRKQESERDMRGKQPHITFTQGPPLLYRTPFSLLSSFGRMAMSFSRSHQSINPSRSLVLSLSRSLFNMAFVLTSSDEEPGPKTFDEFYKALQSRFFRFEKRPDAAGAPPSTDAQPATPAAAAAGSGSGSAAGTDAATPPSTDSPAAVEQPEACMLCSDRVADAKIGSRLCKCDARSACEGTQAYREVLRIVAASDAAIATASRTSVRMQFHLDLRPLLGDAPVELDQ